MVNSFASFKISVILCSEAKQQNNSLVVVFTQCHVSEDDLQSGTDFFGSRSTVQRNHITDSSELFADHWVRLAGRPGTALCTFLLDFFSARRKVGLGSIRRDNKLTNVDPATQISQKVSRLALQLPKLAEFCLLLHRLLFIFFGSKTDDFAGRKNEQKCSQSSLRAPS